jgi:hypothetical protein
LDSGVHRLGRQAPRDDDPAMENDILIAGLMALGSVVWLAGILLLIARATREEPRPKVERTEPAQPALRPAPGW